DMVCLLQSLRVGPAHVVGLSMSGAIALQLALDAPNLVKSLVLVSTFASVRPKKYRLWFYFAFRFLLVHTLGLPIQARLVSKRIFPHADQIALREEYIQQINQADPNGYRAVMRALALFDVVKRLPEIRIPTLVVSGEEDTTIAVATQRHLSQRIPNAQHVIIPKGGHAITVEHPKVFNETMISFLQKLS
ncbi:MAG: alpha/beta fold hydrolase, partial [Anaerolineales bacterium]